MHMLQLRDMTVVVMRGFEVFSSKQAVRVRVRGSICYLHMSICMHVRTT